MKTLVLLRGLPGAGKSTSAKTIFPRYRHFEADNFFIQDSGKYVFDASKLKDAHKWCQDNVEHIMTYGLPIVVSNTFTTKKEMEPYYELAKKYGYTVFSLIVENRHDGVNVHNVPEETLIKMKERFEVKI